MTELRFKPVLPPASGARAVCRASMVGTTGEFCVIQVRRVRAPIKVMALVMERKMELMNIQVELGIFYFMIDCILGRGREGGACWDGFF